MKTSELKKIVEDNKFIFVNNDCNRSIFVYKNSEAQMNHSQSSFISKENIWFGIDDAMPKVVAHAILDYAYTPLEEREEEEKRYTLQSKLNDYENKALFICEYTNESIEGECDPLPSYFLYVNFKNNEKMEFTQREIDAMPFDTKFFVKAEVK